MRNEECWVKKICKHGAKKEIEKKEEKMSVVSSWFIHIHSCNKRRRRKVFWLGKDYLGDSFISTATPDMVESFWELDLAGVKAEGSLVLYSTYSTMAQHALE